MRLLDADHLRADPAHELGNLLDTRPEPEFESGHLVGAVSLPVPCGKTDAEAGADSVAELVARHLPSLFLPPRQQPLILTVGRADLAEALVEELNRRGRSRVSYFILTAGALAALPAEMVATGPERRHLWRPPDFLAEHVDLLPPPAQGPVLDLGTGSGRAAVWLAERGYRVTGLDADPEALGLGRRLAVSRQVECDFRVQKLRAESPFPRGPWSAVLAFRFLERTVFSRVEPQLLPGGVVVVRTFRLVPGSDRPPARRFRLRPGELLDLFGPPRFEVLVHDQGNDPDGHPAAGIVARKRSPALD